MFQFRGKMNRGVFFSKKKVFQERRFFEGVLYNIASNKAIADISSRSSSEPHILIYQNRESSIFNFFFLGFGPNWCFLRVAGIPFLYFLRHKHRFSVRPWTLRPRNSKSTVKKANPNQTTPNSMKKISRETSKPWPYITHLKEDWGRRWAVEY